MGKTDKKQDKQVKYAECQMEKKKKKTGEVKGRGSGMSSRKDGQKRPQ